MTEGEWVSVTMEAEQWAQTARADWDPGGVRAVVGWDVNKRRGGEGDRGREETGREGRRLGCF